MKTVAIIQARMGSTRLPGKVMKSIEGTPMIGLVLARLARSQEIDEIIVATSDHDANKPLFQYVQKLGYFCFQGSELDVLGRYYQAATSIKADIVVRITGDCPLIDPQLVDEVIRLYRKTGADYCSNVSPPTYPDGLDTEVFSVSSLARAAREAKNSFDREHVTPFLRKNSRFKQAALNYSEDLSKLRWTVDEPADFNMVSLVFEHFSPDIHFSWQQVLELQRRQPIFFAENRNIRRNQGGIMGTGQKLWTRAKRVIPGGNMLLSKRAEMFLPELWPAYFSRAKGCRLWDLDDREYIDMSIMGIGTNILGYGHPEVDKAVHATVASGNMSTLNCPEEVYLAEKLVELHPWADMVRLARTGGEANAVAIRIARAAAGRDTVAICGYHGWHDWYLSANLGDESNLAGHLLPGLEPNGVPQNLRGTVLPFTYNNFAELESLVAENDIGVIKMEVQRSSEPEDDFLQKVRDLATKHNIILIFDECTSGFRETDGGLHKKYGVEPDMAVFGKAMGNGYAITAVIGKRDIMESAQSTFISSTFWTERIGPVAALKTLEVMERLHSWQTITETGTSIQQHWQTLADKHDLTISLTGIPALSGFSFHSANALAYKTFITQEMLAKGYLAGTSVYVCIEHTPEIISDYFAALDPVFKQIKECEEGRDIADLLKGPVCHSGFKRLN